MTSDDDARLVLLDLRGVSLPRNDHVGSLLLTGTDSDGEPLEVLVEIDRTTAGDDLLDALEDRLGLLRDLRSLRPHP